jgi:hypothetical protein
MNNDNGLIWLCDFLILTLIGWGGGDCNKLLFIRNIENGRSYEPCNGH